VLKLSPTTDPDKDEDEPAVFIERADDGYTLSLHTADGPVTFQFRADLPDFPPYRDAIPDWSEQVGIKGIGIGAKLVEETLKTIDKISNSDGVEMRLPSAPNKPIGFITKDEKVSISAIVMARDAGISDW